jgi:DNA polymerase Ligase (LigD)
MESRRFVILRHEPGEAGPRELHWDLMLEFGDSLRTWALANEPRVGEAIAADELPRHRLAYLDYEGPVSRGRGVVTRFDRGTFEVVTESEDELAVDLQGELLHGRLQLKHNAANQRWVAWFMPS